MESKDYVFILLLGLLLLIGLVMDTVPVFALLEIQLIVAIALYLQYRNTSILIVMSVVLVIADAAVGTNPAFSLLSIAIAGVIISSLSSFYPLGKKSPFWITRIVWLAISLVVLELFKQAQVIDPSRLLGYLASNIFIMLVLTAVLANWLTPRSAPDILID